MSTRKAVIAAALATLALALTGCEGDDVRRFHDECDKVGGFVVETGSSFWSTRIDCVKDNDVIYLPGFA